MQNKTLSEDYISRAEIRLEAIEVLFKRNSWADVVRESQEVVELSLKALLMISNIPPPRIHDVSSILLENKGKFSPKIQKELEEMARISRALRRDRELAFYGSEDLTPHEFYKKEDAETAFAQAKKIVKAVLVEFEPLR